MANVLNRTTLELRQSVHSPDYADPPWLLNPDLSAVAGVPAKYWKLTGDVVSEMTAGEKATKDAEISASATAVERAASKVIVDNRELVGVVQVLVDELNELRQWVAALKSVTAASTNYSTLKSGIATLPGTPDRTYAQARTTILSRIDTV